MKLRQLLQIIKEEVNGFYNDWSMNDEPSIADRIYQRQGIDTQTASQQQQQIDAEQAGYVDKRGNTPIKPIPVYKNPKSLDGFTNEARGILLSNGDFYLAQSDVLHDNMLSMLASKGIVPLQATFNYGQKYPEEFVAVIRTFNTNNFSQSSAYDEFPEYYEEIFNIARQKQPFTFRALK